MVEIAEDYGTCNLCKKGKLIKTGENNVGGSSYIILKCNKCNHQVARSAR